MITAVTGPLIVEPRLWTLVFDREAASWWASLIAFGRHKHVRAYAYVPFLHVWVFFDPAFSGTRIILANNSEAERMIASWSVNADLVAVTVSRETIGPAILGFCVPQIKRLLGIRCRALRCDALYRHCLANGGQPLEAFYGSPAVQTAAP
jgi:hypothetical protein